MTEHLDIRRAVRLTSLEAWKLGLVAGTSGNFSARVGSHSVAISPTSLAYDAQSDEDIVLVDLDYGLARDSRRAPSTELPMHLEIYDARPDVGAIVHTHGPNVSALSALRKPLPPVIDEMMIHLGGTIEVTEYAFTGGRDLARNVVAALGDRAGVILANHGNVCVGRTLEEALHAAVVMEASARTYLLALSAGTPIGLPPSAIEKGRALYLAKRQMTDAG